MFFCRSIMFIIPLGRKHITKISKKKKTMVEYGVLYVECAAIKRKHFTCFCCFFSLFFFPFASKMKNFSNTYDNIITDVNKKNKIRYIL